MRPTPLTLLLLLFAIPAFVYAWLMNSTGAAALGFSVLGFVLLRGLFFLHALRDFSESLRISRTTDSAILTQGGHLRVKTEVSAKKTPLLAVLSDIPPAGAVVVQGSTAFSGGRAEYLLRLPVIGTSVFGGVLISAADVFFKTDIRVSYASSPEIKVYAAGIAATFNQDGFSPLDDALERDRHALIAGTETRYFRPYVAGDNTADINWKLSAKYDELYVQTRMDAAGVNPVLIFDLPEEGTAENLVSAFAEASAGALERLRRRDSYPVIVYSGADCLWTGNSRREEEIFAYLSLAGKVRRETALFRHRHRSVLLKEAASIPEKTEFAIRVKESLALSKNRYPTTFERNIRHLTAESAILESTERTSLDDTNMYVVSCALGDISNLSYLISDAAVHQRGVVFVLAGIRGSDREQTVISALYSAGASAVEVLS